MTLNDSVRPEQTERREDETLREESQPQSAPEGHEEEIVTPIEAGVQAQAEREFETERKIPDTCTCAIVSVNGKDVDQVPLNSHHRAA